MISTIDVEMLITSVLAGRCGGLSVAWTGIEGKAPQGVGDSIR